MSVLILHPLTEQQYRRLLRQPPHALMITGPTGSGKRSLAEQYIEAVLELAAGGLAAHAYGHRIQPTGERSQSIGIEPIRELEHFLSLKVPGRHTYNRAVLVEDAHTMTLEAQNSLLKTLEEPPQGTLIVLTVDRPQSMLPTIRSRLQELPMRQPARDELNAYFISRGLAEANIRRLYAASGGLPGLITAMAEQTGDHPLSRAAEHARQLLGGQPFERLCLIDPLSKDRQVAINTMVMLQRMAHISLQSAAEPAARRWHAILEAAYEAETALQTSAQPKLALTNLMLHL